MKIVKRTADREILFYRDESGYWLCAGFLFAASAAGFSLLYTVIDMIQYERETGYSAGNAPVGWLFLCLPASIFLGIIAALVARCFEKKRSGSDQNR